MISSTAVIAMVILYHALKATPKYASILSGIPLSVDAKGPRKLAPEINKPYANHGYSFVIYHKNSTLMDASHREEERKENVMTSTSYAVRSRAGNKKTRTTRIAVNGTAKKLRTIILIKQDKLKWVQKNLPFPLDNFTNGSKWAPRVRRLCNLSRVETLLLFHSDPRHAERRHFYRVTIGHPSLEYRFGWTVLFVVGSRQDPNLTADLAAESRRYGDLVQLPFIDSYRNLTYKFIYGMRWVLLNCLTVQTIVKLDDDVFVHVPMLSKYLRKKFNPQQMSIHCSVYRDNFVVRNPNSRHYLSLKQYPKRMFPPHCHGWAMIFPAWLMYPLYASSFHVPVHGIDDAYVTGDLASACGAKHVDITSQMSSSEGNLLETALGQYIFALYSGERKLPLHNLLWRTLVQMRHERSAALALSRTIM
ncbi:lactosylceramide 1,3-N-acetyl-beta-D-glucosaminyltransferase A-like isoform X2 [Ornithodoros turicata]